MPDVFEIYNRHADQYEALVAREDYQHNIFRKLNQIIPFDGLTVAEFGAGTGRLTCMLAPLVKYIYVFDTSQPMLDVAIAKLQKSGRSKWQVAVGDNRHVSLRDGVADVAISGWSICYMVVGNPKMWQADLAKALGEMRRVVHSGGTHILLETLGTGRKRPHPPEDMLPYFDYLQAYGFRRIWIRTDYQFHDFEAAKALTRFFFGDEMVEMIEQDEQGIFLPECTGIWWLKQAAG